MFEKEEIEKIKKLVENFFKLIDPEITIESLNFRQETIFLEVNSKEPKHLIGERGEILSDVQHLLKAMIKKKFKKDFYLDFDVNNYKKRKVEFLRQLARELADEVALTKKEKILPPMPAYERRIIHLELAARKDVTTESIGKEPERKVVIKPYP
jgi:spoIIIJ-associated protein